MSRSLGRRGFSLVEVVLASVLLIIVTMAAVKAFQFISVQSVRTDDRAFAAEKASQMLEELRRLVLDTDTQISVLDQYENNNFKYTLSTLPEVNGSPSNPDPGDKPEDPISGNTGLKYMRKVFILPVPNEDLARKVYVRVYRAKDGELLAETMSLLRILRGQLFPTQAFDLYVLSIDNVPGWWVDLPTLLSTFNNLVQDLQIRNPGLQINIHPITRLAYGRDPYYKPYINSANGSTTAAATGKVYFYPGTISYTGGQAPNPATGVLKYFEENNMGGIINVDGATQNDTAAYPYPMADQYNNAVRQPDEERMYAAARAASFGKKPEPSLRLLLDRMNAGPGFEKDGTPYDYTNALIINLHGEMFPLPPLRNYSDAAKDPLNRPCVRVVTHPENLHYSTGQDVYLRVYSYATDSTRFTDASTVPISVSIGVNASADKAPLAANVTLQRVTGNSTTAYGWAGAGSPADYSMDTVTYSTMAVITLMNTPVRCAQNGSGNTGLSSGAKLYGMEYIPCPVTGTDFSQDLTSTGNNAKNTARWRIKIDKSFFLTRTGLYTIVTQVGNDTMNISRTYVWVGVNPPLSEQSQFMGDPRHMPYADVKTNKKYNWFFMNDGALVPGYTGFKTDGNNALFDGYGQSWAFGGGNPKDARLCMDVPRFGELLRKGMLNTTSILGNVAGWSLFYLGIGGEIGLLSNGGISSIRGEMWDPGDGTAQSFDEISGYAWGNSIGTRLIAHSPDGNPANTNWVGLPWIGELYPDEIASSWVTNGNLPTGAPATINYTNGGYFRADYNRNFNLYTTATGMILPYEPRKQPGNFSEGTFYDGNDGSNVNAYFSQAGPNNTATLTTAGSNVQSTFNIPLISPITNGGGTFGHRPFTPAQVNNTYLPQEWNESTYSGERTSLAVAEQYYNSNNSGFTTSGLTRITAGGQSAYTQLNGLSKQDANLGASEIGKMGVVNLLRAFMAMGASGVVQGNIPPMPMVSISSPTSSDDFPSTTTSINVVWTSTWTRWDGQAYTEAYPNGYTSAAGINYNAKVSADGGKSWTFINTNIPAVADVYDSGNTVTSSFATPLVWDVSTFPGGEYLLRIEAYNASRQLHHSYHVRRVYIKR